MKRTECEHTIRAAGAVLGVNEVLVIGSQALHASVPGDLPDEASRSVEADIAALEDVDGRLADLIDSAIGEVSMFHETFGYYAEGVVSSTAVLPSGWRERLVRFETPATAGVVAWCRRLVSQGARFAAFKGRGRAAEGSRVLRCIEARRTRSRRRAGRASAVHRDG